MDTTGLPQSLGASLSDIGDALGIGSARREREFNAEQALLNRIFQSSEADKQRKWEKMMSDTAYQRAFNDMQAAGINPAMVFSNGTGSAASTPSGASASGSQAHSSSGGSSSFSSLVNSAAHLSYSFNSDKNSANDMNSKQMISTIQKLASLMQ